MTDNNLGTVLDKKTVGDLYYNKKWSMQRIGNRFGVTRERIRQLMQEWGMPRREKTPTPAAKRNKKICKDYNSGAPIEELVKKYKVSKKTVYSVLKGQNNSYREKQKDKARKRKRRNALIRYHYRNGMSQKEIAKEFNLAQTNISNIVKGEKYNKKRVFSKGKAVYCGSYLPKTYLKALREHAKAEYCSMSGVVGRLIKRHLTRTYCLDIVGNGESRKSSRNFTFTLSSQEYSILTRWARKRGVSKSATIRSLINRYLGKKVDIN